jgi:predicted amidohydrolase
VSSLTVAVVQLAASLDPAENRAALDVLGGVAAAGNDLAVLPEAFMRDFGEAGSDVAPFAEDLDGPFVTRLSELAAAHGLTVVAGMFERSEDPARPYNTLVAVGPGGPTATYRKIHLYDSFGYRESDRLLAGKPRPVTVDVGGFTVGLMTCYDLRFPEHSRALVDQGADLLVTPAAWVAGPRKVDHWRTLLKARAIENTVYVAAAAQPGPRYSGRSMVVTPRGDADEMEDAGGPTLSVRIDHDELEAARVENPSLRNRRLRS